MSYHYESEHPLDNEFESLMDQVGCKLYLKEIIKKLGIKLSVSPNELSDYECRKVIRMLIRNSNDYRGTLQ